MKLMRMFSIATVYFLSIGMAAGAQTQEAETTTTVPLSADMQVRGEADVLSPLPWNATEIFRMPYDSLLAQAQAGMDFLERQAIGPTSELISDTFSWFHQESSSAIHAATESLGDRFEESFEALQEIPEWPGRSIDRFLRSMQADETSEFGMLVNDSGFALAHVAFGINFLPVLSVHFHHVRDLTFEERLALDSRIDEFISDHKNGVGYIEATILRALVRAGEYSDSINLQGVDISILPLPGLTLQVDPFGYEFE